jgi:hypothetical protein
MYDRSTDATLCVRCANLIVPEGARQRWWLWLCAANKQEPLWNALTGQMDGAEPYKRCKGLNGGDCCQYEPGPTIFNPRPMPPEAA